MRPYSFSVVEILGNAVRNSKFEDSAIESERQVLIRKLQEAEGNITDVVFDNLHATAFQGTPFSLSPLGNVQALQYVFIIDLIANYFL